MTNLEQYARSVQTDAWWGYFFCRGCEACPAQTYCHAQPSGTCCRENFLQWAGKETAGPPNGTLTLEELRGMDGEPVRIEENGEYQYGLVSLSGCAFTPKDEVITLCNGDFYLLAEMEGNYKVYPIAYRRKPDGGWE